MSRNIAERKKRWSRKREDAPEDPLTALGHALRLSNGAAELFGVDSAATKGDDYLREQLKKHGLDTSDENMVTLRKAVGPWLPTPLSKPRRRFLTRRPQYSEQELADLFTAVEVYRDRITQAGLARLHTYEVSGLTPNSSIADILAPTPQRRANRDAHRAAIRECDRRNKLGRAAGADLLEATQKVARRRETRRLVRNWKEIAESNFYYQVGDPGTDLASLEQAALDLVHSIRDDRLPPGVAGRLRRIHRDCIGRAMNTPAAKKKTEELLGLATEFNKLVKEEKRAGRRKVSGRPEGEQSDRE